MSFTLAIDGRHANAAQRAGIGNYCFEILRALPPLLGDVRLRVYLDAPPRKDFPLSSRDAELTVLPPRRLWTQRALPGALKADPPDLLFCPSLQAPLRCPCPVIVTVHDLAFLTFKDEFTWQRRTLARLQAWQAARQAAHLIADSEGTKRDLERLLRVNPEKITVAYAGAAPQYRSNAFETRAPSPETRPYILYVGRLQPRKNIGRLVEAFSQVVERHPELPHRLLLAGAEGWLFDQIYGAVSHASARDRIEFLGFVPEDDLPGLMREADVLALVSLWEGFGLPVVEAMACGTAVLTSNCSSLPEVAGEAALLVDPTDTSAIAAGLERLLLDVPFRRALEAAGPAQAARFSWQATARKILTAAEQVVEQSRRQ
ncbi:MAG: glycosyltransferase family 4 protein [Candidatus Hydrogenedentes bacterium]|nr:glycosyltransferase family 4 protein [Candidatus Hydrogenedentota bacterium]